MIRLKFTQLFTAVLLSGFCCVVTAQDKENTKEINHLAPEATAAEATLSFRDVPPLTKAFIDEAPANRKDFLEVGLLSDGGLNKDSIVKLAAEIANKQYGQYDSLLIAHKNKLVFESYYLRGRIDLPHPQASATKGYTSLALGRAIQMGYLTMADLDKPLVSFLKELDLTKLVDGAEKITLHKALTMQGGLSISSEKWEELQNKPLLLQGQGLVQTLLEHSDPITKETQTYLYGNFNPMLVMTVIDAVVPGTAQDFIQNEIFDKLGVANYDWKIHFSGLPQAGSRMSITSRDMVKVGIMVLNKGKWKGEQLISADYLAKATSGLVNPTQDWIPDTYRYGYFWYQAPIAVDNTIYSANFAWGGGGQRVIVVDELELTIVISGHDREDQIMTQVVDSIIPVFANLSTRPVIFVDPPAFVERYAAEMKYSEPSASAIKSEVYTGHVEESDSVKVTDDFAYEKALLHKVFFEDESPDTILSMFTHPEKVQRVKIALAFAALNAEFTHNEESGFADKRKQFWEEEKDHLSDIQNALGEALIMTAADGTTTRIPYTLAWMPGQDHKTVELLAWAAKHHQDYWVRRFAVYFVVRFGGDEAIADELLRDRSDDPHYSVRKQVLILQLSKIKVEDE